MFAAAVILAGCSGSQYAQESRTKYRDDANRTGTKANAISRRSIDVLPQERAYLILPDDNIRVDGVSGNIVMLPPGDHSFNFYRLKGTTGGSVSVPVGGGFSVGVSTPGTRTGNIEDAVTGTGTVEAGKYYKVENVGTQFDVRGNIVELTGEELEQARAQVDQWLALWEPAEIGGVVWAGTNVGERGRFVSTPEDYGNQYPFDEAQRACPEGWRVPTTEEFAALIASGHERAEVSGVAGRMFGSEENKVFLPNAGTINGAQAGHGANYWSSSPHNDKRAYAIGFNSAGQRVAHSAGYYRVYGMSVRCVRER